MNMFGVASSDDTKIYECLRCGHVETRARKKSKAVSLGGLFRERTALMPSSRITCRSINLRHVVVTDGSCVTVIPIYRDITAEGSDDRTLVCRVALPPDAVSNLEFSRLIASHLPLGYLDPENAGCPSRLSPKKPSGRQRFLKNFEVSV
jgi:hypothetical protein